MGEQDELASEIIAEFRKHGYRGWKIESTAEYSAKRIVDKGYLSPEEIEAKCQDCGIEDVKEQFAFAAKALGELQDSVEAGIAEAVKAERERIYELAESQCPHGVLVRHKRECATCWQELE